MSNFGTRLSGYIDNVNPGCLAGLSATAYTYYADQTGTSNDPKLVVTYTGDANAGAFFLLFD